MKPEYVTDEMEVAFRQNVITTNRGSLIGLKAAIAAAINVMPQTDTQAQIEALKAERDALRETLLKVARMAEALKRPCGMEPDSPQAIRNGKYMDISYVARAALAKEPTGDYQLLCCNCNQGKARNGGVCPHHAKNQS